MSGEWWRPTHQLVPNEIWTEVLQDRDRLRGLLRDAGRRHDDSAWQAAVWEALGYPGNHPNAINKGAADQPAAVRDPEAVEIVRCPRCHALPRPSLMGGCVCPNCGTTVLQPVPESAPAARPFNLRFDREWLSQKIASDPNDEPSAGSAGFALCDACKGQGGSRDYPDDVWWTCDKCQGRGTVTVSAGQEGGK